MSSLACQLYKYGVGFRAVESSLLRRQSHVQYPAIAPEMIPAEIKLYPYTSVTTLSRGDTTSINHWFTIIGPISKSINSII